MERPSLYPGLYPVTPQQLFVHTIDDLEARLDLNRGEYDALMMAWLIRKLLHDGHRSLLAIVARERGIDDEDLPRFEIHDIVAPPQLIGPLPLAPIAGRPTRVLTGREFLRQDVLGVPDYAGGIEAGTEMATVSDLIFYLANVLGAVHVTERPEPLHRKMLDVTWTVNYTTPGGQIHRPGHGVGGCRQGCGRRPRTAPGRDRRRALARRGFRFRPRSGAAP